MRVLVTGVAGFIGAAFARRLLGEGVTVIGIDNMNDYYDVSLKESRLALLKETDNSGYFSFEKVDITDRGGIEDLFDRHGFSHVVHLAAQAGVRYSIENAYAYIDSNLVGFGNILECCRALNLKHLVYASSSSVYGKNKKLPFSEKDNVDHPISLYAATKKANELMAHTYSHLYDLPTTGLRFFTVYGPWGRPDMALFKFTKALLRGEPIPVYNRGEMIRDFTYVDDIVEAMVRIVQGAPGGGADDVEGPRETPYALYNIGNNRPTELMRYIEVIENCLNIKAKLDLLPMQEGDVKATAADVTALENDFGYRPAVTVEEGVRRFVDWYRSYYNVDS